MIPVRTRSGQNIAVFGLGASGIATAAALRAGGSVVAAWDDGDDTRRRAAEAGVALSDLYNADWSGFDALALSPGVPLTHPQPHPIVNKATDAGVTILGDIELLAESCPRAVLVGVTGTNGKSTTTALIHHLLAGGPRPVQAGGNLGPPALALDPLPDGGVYVLELSSYQLDLTHEARFDVAVLLNISPDHLDRHGGMEGYLAAKTRIFRDRAGGGQTAVVGVDDAPCAALADELTARGWDVIRISVGGTIARGVSVVDGALHDNGDRICDLSGMDTLPGRHNWQNAAAAYVVARRLAIPVGDVVRRLATFPGLPHRQERVGRDGKVRFVNDSKATNPDAAARALACYDNIFWIAGGIAKDDGLGPVMAELGQVRRAFLIGEAANEFAAALEGHVATEISGDLSGAVAAAHEAARRSGQEATVLLSPACASFDQFRNFAARGDAFRDLVQARLKAEAGT